MTLWIMMLDNHTKFGDKIFCDSEDIIKTFTDILTFCCDLDIEHTNPVFPEEIPAYDAVLSNQDWLQMDQQFRWYIRNSHILIV